MVVFKNLVFFDVLPICTKCVVSVKVEFMTCFRIFSLVNFGDSGV